MLSYDKLEYADLVGPNCVMWHVGELCTS